MIIPVNLGNNSYDIILEQGAMKKAGQYFNLNRKVLVVTDTGVPIQYARTVAACSKESVIEIIPQGEENKSLASFEKLLKVMLAHNFTRKDCVVAVGGGLVGDLAGFAASAFMRGIDFYNIPTTVLAQVDSSIGGKTAVNLGSIKNIVGAFYQPKKVIIDIDALKTLPKRHISAGLAEALKMSVNFDPELFAIFENGNIEENMEKIIEHSLRIKGKVVEEDETEQGIRKVLNFGHTIGHGIESQALDGSLYHGECVALGMLPMCSPALRKRLIPILKKLELPTTCRYNPDRIMSALLHDKKTESGFITIIEADTVGSYRMRKIEGWELKGRLSLILSEEKTMEYGLIGEHLPHSFSKTIHEQIGDYSYELHEIDKEELGSFMSRKEFKGINVTIPYKQAVIPYLDEISGRAQRIGAVNTIVNRDGKLYGDNTDYMGMLALANKLGIDFTGKKVMILGTGGTSRTARAIAADQGARQILIVSRTGKDGAITYEQAYADHADTQIIINTTPCGMFPRADEWPIDPDCFPDLVGVIDAIYNPLQTEMIRRAKKRGIPAEGGLYMLVAQAVYAAEQFMNTTLDTKALIDKIYKDLYDSKRNIVLIGMSMAGKTTVGQLLAQKLGMTFTDTDHRLVEKEGRPVTEIFATEGEPFFRDLESQVVRKVASETGTVIATGGGAALREENIYALQQNGIIFFLDRSLDQITPTADRPLANTPEKIAALFHRRYPVYLANCDYHIENNISPEDAAAKIIQILS